MKKLLLASTALVMSAGIASAQGVSLSGSAKMGFLFDSTDTLGATGNESVTLMHEIDVTFTLSGETDGGLAFGASFDADSAIGAGGGTSGTVFVSGEFGTLTFGDVDGAAENIVGDLAGVGLDGVGDGNENTYLTSAAPGFNRIGTSTGALYEYSLDGFDLAVSATNLNGGPTGGSEAVSIGAGYSMDMFAAGIGVERSTGGAFGTVNHAIAFVEAGVEGVTAKATFGRISSGIAPSDNQVGVSVEGSFDATTVTAYARRTFADTTNYGVGASYDLGGGASLAGGVARLEGPGVAPDQTLADLGLSFSF